MGLGSLGQPFECRFLLNVSLNHFAAFLLAWRIGIFLANFFSRFLKRKACKNQRLNHSIRYLPLPTFLHLAQSHTLDFYLQTQHIAIVFICTASTEEII